MSTPSNDRDYYRLLGVSQDASPPEIRRAYRRLARQHHPDRNPHPDSPEQFRALADAYAALTDPARRACYDHTVRPAGPPHAPRPQPPLLPRHGTLELSGREAQLAATTPLTLTTVDGIAIVLPAGVADGDQVTVAMPAGWAVLTVRVNLA